MECIEPLPFTLGWHLAMDKMHFFYTFDEVRNIYSVPLVVCLGYKAYTLGERQHEINLAWNLLLKD